MKKYFVLILFVLALGQVFGQRLRHKEVLGRPTSTSILVQTFFDDAAEVRVQYGTTSGSLTSQTGWQTFAAGAPADVNLTGLSPNTTYYYRVTYRMLGGTTVTNRPQYSFTTPRSLGTDFTFIVQADPHLDSQSDTALYRICLNNQAADKPDFMIDMGDFLMTDKLKNLTTNQIPRDTIVYRSHLLRSYYETVCHSAPLYLVMGNHEGEAGWYNTGTTGSNIAVWNTLERKKYFPNPFPNTFYKGDTTNYPFVGQRASYYAWEWGDALFVVLDPYWFTQTKPDSLNGWRWTLGKTQYDWLKKTLEQNNSKFKFVFCHQLVGGDPDGRGGIEYANRYEWGGDNLNGTPGFAANRPGWYKPIKDLLTENKVNIFFHGHDHFFGKQEKDCLIYQELPQPSHPVFSNANQAAAYGYFQGQILPNSGHVRIKVSATTGVKLEYVRAYLPQSETTTRRNRDVSATYYIGVTNCYNNLSTSAPVLWNSDYTDELVYPNPFGNETKIEFSLFEPEVLSLSIYDERGHLVRSLLDKSEVPSGRFQIVWEGKDVHGNELPSGAYFYSIKGDKGTKKQGKLWLMK